MGNFFRNLGKTSAKTATNLAIKGANNFIWAGEHAVSSSNFAATKNPLAIAATATSVAILVHKGEMLSLGKMEYLIENLRIESPKYLKKFLINAYKRIQKVDKKR